jgi:hypothetical protein
VLKMQINKSDRNDAAGIARIMQTGWFNTNSRRSRPTCVVASGLPRPSRFLI